MQNFMLRILRAEAGDPSPGGAFPPPPAATPPVIPPVETPVAPAANDKLDDFGYEKPESVAPPAPVTPPVEPPVEETPPEVKAPATGYTGEPAKVEDPPPAPVTPPVEPPKPDDTEKLFEGLPKDEIDKVKAFVGKNKIEPDTLKAFAEMRKAEFVEAKKNFEAYQKEQQRQLLAQRAAWHKELKEDPTLGGSKFQTNVSRAERVLEEEWPEYKKVLTESKGVVPAYIMRGFMRVADRLYPDQKLVQGDPPTAAEPKENANDALDFYT